MKKQSMIGYGRPIKHLKQFEDNLKSNPWINRSTNPEINPITNPEINPITNPEIKPSTNPVINSTKTNYQLDDFILS